MESDEIRRELLQVVGSNSIWDGTSLTIEFAQPFDSLALLSGEGAGAGPALSALSEEGSDLVSQQGIEPLLASGPRARP